MVGSLALDDSIEVLKKTLPLMSRLRIPTTPENYAIWFTHVSGCNPALSSEIEARLADGSPFTPEILRDLYVRHTLLADGDALEELRARLGEMLARAGAQVQGARAGIGAYGEALAEADDRLAESLTSAELRALVSMVATETRRAKRQTSDVEAVLDRMKDEVQSLRSEIQRLARDSDTDGLTGIANRRAFDRELANWIDSVRDGGQPLSLIMMDIDHFKRFNDEHGHVAGDRAIAAVAGVVADCAQGQDLAARYGGEEFALLMPLTGLDGAMVMAETLRALVESTRIRLEKGGKELRATISVGVAQLAPADDATGLIARADTALYESKRAGRNRVTAAGAVAGRAAAS